jgi:hypothetical protein
MLDPVGDTWNSQVCPPAGTWVTVIERPATNTEPLREEPLFGDTANRTDPDPVPEVGPVAEMNSAAAEADQAHPADVVTAIVNSPPDAATWAGASLTVNAQDEGGAPAVVTGVGAVGELLLQAPTSALRASADTRVRSDRRDTAGRDHNNGRRALYCLVLSEWTGPGRHDELIRRRRLACHN